MEVRSTSHTVLFHPKSITCVHKFIGTNDGMWPYSYDSCDVGTLPNASPVLIIPACPKLTMCVFQQTWPNGTSPVAAKKSGDPDYGGELSYVCRFPSFSL